MRMLLLRMLLLVMVMVMTPQGVQAESTCTAVTEMKSRITYITCHFQIDASKYDFNVQFFPSDGSTQETALACNHQKSEELNCHKASGVEFDEHQKIRYYFTFTRNAALSPAGSEYMCQRVPSEGGDTAKRCKVGEIDIPEVPEPTSPPADTPPADTDGSGESPAVITLLVIIIVIVVAIGICGALAYVKRDRITNWWTKSNGVARTEENMDPEKNTSQTSSPTRTEFFKIPQGWPTYFYNMGWRDGEKGEAMPMEEEKHDRQPKAAGEEPQAPGHKQPTSGGKKREPNLGDRGAAAPLLEPNLGDRGAAAPLLEGMKAERSGASTHESHDGDLFYDAKENPVSSGGEASVTPGKKDMNKLPAEHKKAEEKRVKREKEAAVKKAKETIRNADREAKRITKGAKGKSQEEKEKAKSEADRIKQDGKKLAQQIKEGAGKGDNEGNQEATTTV